VTSTCIARSCPYAVAAASPDINVKEAAMVLPTRFGRHRTPVSCASRLRIDGLFEDAITNSLSALAAELAPAEGRRRR
jgi:hypothetical protein